MEDMVLALSEFDAKRMLMSAVDVMEKKLVCEQCVRQTICGSEATHDSCKRVIIEELRLTKGSPAAAETEDSAEAETPDDAADVIYYDPATMKVLD